MRILVVEDEKQLAQNIKDYFAKKGWAIDLAPDGEEGMFLAQNESYDLLILDLALPDMDGLKICQSLRSKGKRTPILILTARSSVEEKVMGLNAGADDYLAKPFAFSELEARLVALIRRSQSEGKTILKIRDLALDPLKHLVLLNHHSIELSPKEFAILEILLRRKGQILTRSMLTEHVWDYNFESMSNLIDVFISTLRRKIGKGYIKTVHGVGYKIE